MYLASGSVNLKIYDCLGWKVKFDQDGVDGVGSVDPVDGNRGLRSLRWCDDGRYLVLVGDNGENGSGAEIFYLNEDGARRVQVVPVEGAERPTAACFYRGTPRTLAVGTDEGAVHFWDTKSKCLIKTFRSRHGGAVEHLDLNPNNAMLACSVGGGPIVLHSTSTNADVGTVTLPRSDVSFLRFHREYRSALGVAARDGSLLLRDLNVGKDRMFSREAHAGTVTGFDFSPLNRDVMASCSCDEKIILHDLRLQTKISTINTNKFLTSVSMNAESHIAVGTNKGEIVVYDLRNFKKPLHSMRNHASAVVHLAFQPSALKSKNNANVNISPKEVAAPKPTPSKFVNKSDILNASSPQGKSGKASLLQSLNKVDQTGKDSFLAIINQTVDSLRADEIDKNMTPEHVPGMDDSVPKESAATSTPVDAPFRCNKKDIPASPITGNGIENASSKKTILAEVNKKEMISSLHSNSENKNSVNLKNLSYSKMNIDSVDSSSIAEIVKYVSDTANELKDHIRYSKSDINSENLRNHVNAHIQHVKLRLYLEDQIESLNQKMDTILEDNNKLQTSVEILNQKMDILLGRN